VAVDLSGWENVILNIAKQMHEGSLKPGQLDRDVITKTYKDLNGATGDGYGKGWDPTSKEPPSRDALLMQRNIFKFSGAKTYSMMLEMNEKLVKDGKRTNYEDFKKEVLKLNSNYNLNHLQAEHQTAEHSGKIAVIWEAAQRNKARFPNMKFKTQEDEKVSDEHRALNDIVAAIDSAFWKTHMPPLRFRCRCYPKQTAEGVSPEIPKIEVPEEFQNNVGETKEVFKETGKKPHPYFAVSKRNPDVQKNIQTYLVQKSRNDLRKWANTALKNKKIRNKDLDREITLTNSEVKSITGKPHENQLDRNDLLYTVAESFEGAELVKTVPENKGRYQYVKWLYFKAASGNFYFNVVQLRDGSYKLHAISDKIKGAE
jgi:SPP1 gp7 family putative phage head morphogenesis protein